MNKQQIITAKNELITIKNNKIDSANNNEALINFIEKDFYETCLLLDAEYAKIK